ncbi:MAG: hypothetical protein ACI4XM_02990 [Candidatus Coprovivens sp.]
MKIVNIENGNKKVYVQLNDVMMLMQLDSLIPAEVMDKVFSKVFIVTDDNRFEFAEFTEPSTVDFFESCDWIPDFRYYKNMSEEEIIADGQMIADEMNSIGVKWNAMSDQERDKNEDLLTRYHRLEFKMHSTAEILWTKQGHRIMPFPIVPDFEGFKVAEKEGCPYVAQQGLNPLQVLIYRIDGTSLDSKRERFSQGLIQASESILINDNLEHNEFFGNSFERMRFVSDDGKYLVISFKILPELEKDNNLVIDTEQSNNIAVDKSKSLSKRIKDWINKRFR